MPVVYIKEVAPDVKLGLWKIEEDVLQFLSDFSDMKKWEPWAITFFIFLIYQVTSDIRQKNK